MPNCPNCEKKGFKVEGELKKEWDMHAKNGRGPSLHIKHYVCPTCGKRFRLTSKIPDATIPESHPDQSEA